MRLPRAGTSVLSYVTGLAMTGNPLARSLLRGISRAQLRLQVPEPALRARLTPDYPIGCKRVLFTNDWLPAMRRPDVSLVTAPIERVTPTGVRTADGTEHHCDILVYGTGFAATEFLSPVRVTGRNGVRLDDVWRDGARAYLGMAVPGFPNLFLMYGPNTNTGNASVVYFHEAQARYLVQAVRALSDGPLEARPDVTARFDAELQARLAGSVWTGCRSWYRTEAGRVVTNWPGMAGEYRRRTASLARSDYLDGTGAGTPDPNTMSKSPSTTVSQGRRPAR